MRQRQLVVTNRSTLVPILYFWHAELLQCRQIAADTQTAKSFPEIQERV